MSATTHCKRMSARDRIQQAAGIGVLRSAHDLFGRAALDDFAKVEHIDPVDDLADDGKVMRDEEIGEAMLILQSLEQIEDLSLNRNVECGYRFVANQDCRPDGQRACDRDPLAFAAGQRGRAALGVVLRQVRRRAGERGSADRLASPISADGAERLG